jgi:hypothetical protein
MVPNVRSAGRVQDTPQNVGSASSKPGGGDSGKSLEELEQEIATNKLQDSEQSRRRFHDLLWHLACLIERWELLKVCATVDRLASQRG